MDKAFIDLCKYLHIYNVTKLLLFDVAGRADQ